MEGLLSRPVLTDIYRFISEVDAYPVSVDELIELARKIKAPRPIIEFYKSFGRQLLFKDQDDLLSRSEQVGLMRQEEREMPRELELLAED